MIPLALQRLYLLCFDFEESSELNLEFIVKLTISLIIKFIPLILKIAQIFTFHQEPTSQSLLSNLYDLKQRIYLGIDPVVSSSTPQGIKIHQPLSIEYPF